VAPVPGEVPASKSRFAGTACEERYDCGAVDRLEGVVL
jgi:hypothetical protein